MIWLSQAPGYEKYTVDTCRFEMRQARPHSQNRENVKGNYIFENPLAVFRLLCEVIRTTKKKKQTRPPHRKCKDNDTRENPLAVFRLLCEVINTTREKKQSTETSRWWSEREKLAHNELLASEK